MKVPKYIKKMINDRYKAQNRANELQVYIENWFEAHNIDVEYSGTHVVLYTEPSTAKSKYLEALEEHEEGYEDGYKAAKTEQLTITEEPEIKLCEYFDSRLEEYYTESPNMSLDIVCTKQVPDEKGVWVTERITYCKGTKEQDRCSCYGNKSKCTLYRLKETFEI